MVVGSASGCVQAEFLFSKAVSLRPGSGRTSLGGANTVLGGGGEKGGREMKGCTSRLCQSHLHHAVPWGMGNFFMLLS